MYYFPSFQSRSQPLKEKICSSRSKFFPLRVDLISKTYLIQRSKQEFIQTKILFFAKRQEALIRAGVFIRINMVGCDGN